MTDATGIQVDSKKVDLDRPIKQVGTHEVSVKLHREVSVIVTIDVVADEVIASGAEDLEEALADGDGPTDTSYTPSDDAPGGDTVPGMDPDVDPARADAEL